MPKRGSFADMVALKGDKEIGDKMNKIISRLAEANDLKGVIDVADFNDADKLGKGKEMVDRLDGSTLILADGFFEHFGKQPRLDEILFGSRPGFVNQEGVARTVPLGSAVLSFER